MSDHVADLLERPTLKRYRPNRRAGNFYRAAVDDPNAVGGVALDSVESAVTAAVRLGYRIAAAQVDRTASLARRFRDAADQATGVQRDKGESSEKKALDATEQLIFKAMMGALGWLEAVAANDGNPVRRAASAQFRLLGSMLGLLPPDQPVRGTTRPPEPQPVREDTAERSRRAGRSVPRPPTRQPHVRHAPNGAVQERRAVRIRDWEIAAEALGNYQLTFYRDAGDETIAGELSVGRTGAATLTVTTSRRTVVGLYTAAICDSTGLQLGYLEIMV